MGYYYYSRCQKTKQYNQLLWTTVTSYYQSQDELCISNECVLSVVIKKHVRPQSLPNKYRNKSKKSNRAACSESTIQSCAKANRPKLLPSCKYSGYRAGLFRQKESRQCVAILLWAPSWGSSCVSWVSLFVVFVALVSNGALCAFGSWNVFLPPA